MKFSPKKNTQNLPYVGPYVRLSIEASIGQILRFHVGWKFHVPVVPSYGKCGRDTSALLKCENTSQIGHPFEPHHIRKHALFVTFCHV